MTMPCNPIPCPDFQEVTFTDVKPIGWIGADIKFLEGDEDFRSKPVPEMVADMVTVIHAQAAEIRDSYRYTPDTIIRVKLPDDSNLSDLFELLKGAVDDRIQFI